MTEHPQQEPIVTEEKLWELVDIPKDEQTRDDIINWIWSLPVCNKVPTRQCENCIRKGLRECMYHGYPYDNIPISCSYKIGDAAVDTVYDVPTVIRSSKQAGGE